MSGKPLEQLTVRGLDADLKRRLDEVARESGMSLNRAAILLMRRGAGLDRKTRTENVIGHELDRFIGVLSEKEARRILEDVAALDVADEGLWR